MTAALLFLAAATLGLAQTEPHYDVVVRNGRVMDPETNRDEVADVGIRDGRIVAISDNMESGRQELDASGLVVAPGFVDILGSVPPNRHAHTHKITDGVTTSFGMHGGPIDISGYVSELEKSGALVNYGVTVGHRRLREAVGVDDRYLPANRQQIEKMKELAARALAEGAVGIGFGINYSPGAQ